MPRTRKIDLAGNAFLSDAQWDRIKRLARSRCHNPKADALRIPTGNFWKASCLYL